MTSTTISDTSIDELRGTIRGEIILPSDPSYDEARKVHNGMIDRHPAVIVRCADDADVMSAVVFARDNGLPLSIRGGGHNPNGFAVNDDGLVVDMSPMKGVHVDPASRTVRVQGGCTWGDVDHAAHAFGLAVPGGIISTTGVAGLTLGGGIGHLTRRCGLSIDNLIAADVVTADGKRITASEKENSDLLWALRGGGGNFGVVTSFQFKAHPVHTIFGGPVFWPLERGAEAMRFYREFMAEAPEEMNAFFAFLIVPPAPPFPAELHNKTVCGVAACYAGDLDKGEAMTRPLTEFGPPVFQHVGPMPLPMLQSAFDPLVPSGLQNYWKADFLTDLTDEVIAANIEYGSKVPTFQTAIHIYPVNGAAHRVGKNDTAWSYREANYSQVMAGMWPDPADTEKNRQWVRDYWEAIHPHSSGGAYVNFMQDEGEDRVAASYRDNYQRLAQIKAQYDPNNLFRMNQNIKPAG